MNSNETGWMNIEPAYHDGSTEGMISEFRSVGLEARVEDGILQVRTTPSTPSGLRESYANLAKAALELESK